MNFRIRDIFDGIKEGWVAIGTCSIANPKDKHATFARTKEHLKLLEGFQGKLMVFVPKGLDYSGLNISALILTAERNFFEYEFTLLHNEINRGRAPAADVIGRNLEFHPSSVIGEGIRVAVGPGGAKAQLKHMGNVVFGDDVYVGPHTLIQRGTLDSTIIGNGVKIDNHCTVGHNDVIGENTVMATGTVLGGSVRIGKNCWLGLNCTIRNGVSICDNVSIGMGAGVTKDITEPGIYAGCPAKKIKDLPEGWNF